MCNKLRVFCLLLAAASVASAAANIDVTHPLKVDIDGAGTVTPQGDWRSWLISDWSYNAPRTVSYAVRAGDTPPNWVTCEITPVGTVGNGGGGSRNRSGGLTFVVKPAGNWGTPDLSGTGLGRNYLQLKLTNLQPNKEHEFLMWSFEQKNVWSVNSDNPNSKWGVWSTLNPNAWLVANGRSGLNGEPNGYGPKWTGLPAAPTTDTNMPAAMQTAAFAHGGRGYIASPGTDAGLPEWLLGETTATPEGYAKYVRFRATSSASGVITLYGWIDGSDWGGSYHMPINGFMVIPEPATVALLGLGGLLLRRKRS
jgi:hypothetical protein